ncbi:alpha/beta fold hydrolase [Aliterella atlantica]|uniref:Alpha/beta hydrolase n=1 Tax=Aliterella atlantica CENA595 TaxID=1618023 RepID=A0A0D8ZVM1_9CYAN|nr:alpha/beta hydrolase [Aliterella atlantica]KJH72780.1 alpha/beta hydrolase [Aliterella atlantica CENA595]
MRDWWQATFPQGRQSLTIIDANGYPVQIAYGEKGVGIPLLLVHGLGSWSYNWRHCVEPLSQHFRVICFDAKGYGFSDKPMYPERSDHQIIEMQRVINALCNEPPVIVAESLGALVSLGLAQAYPKLVKALVVVNVPIFPESLPHWGMLLLSQIPFELAQTIDSLRLTYLFAPLFKEVMAVERRSVLYDPSILTAEDLDWICYPFTQLPGTIAKAAQEVQIAAREIEHLQANKPNLISKIQSALGLIKCPTLILWGEQDSWYPYSDGKKLRDRIPNSKLEIIPNCGHDASFGAASVVTAAVLKFLQDIVPRD